MFYLYGIMLYNIQNYSFKEVPMNTPSPDLSSNFLNFKRSYKVAEKELAAISVYNCGSQRCTPGYQWGPGRRDHYLIHYIISGTGTCTIGSTTYSVSPGQAFLTQPNTTISYRADDTTPWHYCWAGFSGIDAPLILRQTPFMQQNTPVITVANGAQIQKSFKKIWLARGTTFDARVQMTGQLYAALALLITPEETETPAIRHFIRTVDYIKKNYFSYSLSVETLAENLGINRSYLYTVFKESCGLSPKTYLTRFRMKQASTLLIQSHLSITAISYSVGYEDNMYFSKVFKKVTGMAPSVYRETYQDHPDDSQTP